MRTMNDPACAFAQSDLGIRCPLTESLDTAEYIDKQRRPCADWNGSYESSLFAFDEGAFILHCG